MEKTGVHKCELCDKQFKSRQSKWMHKQRLHPSGGIDNTDIENRIVVLENRMKEMQAELDALRAKHVFNSNNSFSAATVVNINANETLNINHAPTSPSSNSCSKRLSLDGMHPFDVETDEFLSVAQFKACGYSLVRLLELSHFNPSHPEHMNCILSPHNNDYVYILDSDRQWVKVSNNNEFLMTVLSNLVRRVKVVNPVEALKYDDNNVFYSGEGGAISFKVLQGMKSHSKICIKTLTDLGILLPEDLVEGL